jgi:hypothetical protein
MDITSLAPLMEFLKQYNQLIQEQVKQQTPEVPKQAYRSTEINEMAEALSKAQGDYEPLNLGDINTYTHDKYALFDDIIRSVRPALVKNGLTLTQIKESCDGYTMLYSELIHTSGQWLKASTRIIPPQDDLNQLESIINRHKKIDAMALLNITAKNDPFDDDAELAMQKVRNKEVKGTDLDYQYKPKAKRNTTTVTKDHLEELEIELEEFPDLVKGIYDANHIESLADLPENEYRPTIDRIRKLKLLRSQNDCK